MLETVILINYTSPQLSPTIHAVQNDTGRVLVCKVSDFNIPDGAVARFRARKPDGTSVFNNAEITEKKVRVELTSQLLSVPGSVQCNVEIVHNDKKIHSFYFLIDVERLVISDDEIESTNEFQYLDTVVKNAENALNKANTAISTAETAATNANDKAEYANTQGNYAKEQGDYAKEQGNFAKLHGGTAQTATSEAQTATEQANTATLNATTQANYAKEQGDYAKLHGGTAQTATQAANNAAQSASEQATHAQTQGDHAKTQGDYAKVQGQGAETAKTQAETAAQSANQAANRANSAAEACEGIAAGVGNKAELITFNDSNSNLGANNVQLAIDKTIEKVNANTKADKIMISHQSQEFTLQQYVGAVQQEFNGFRAFATSEISGEVAGIHGLRYHNDQLQVKKGQEWVAIQSSSNFFDEFENKKTVFHNRAVVVSSDKFTKQTMFESDGSVFERIYSKIPGGGMSFLAAKRTVFNSDGSISEIREEEGAP